MAWLYCHLSKNRRWHLLLVYWGRPCKPVGKPTDTAQLEIICYIYDQLWFCSSHWNNKVVAGLILTLHEPWGS